MMQDDSVLATLQDIAIPTHPLGQHMLLTVGVNVYIEVCGVRDGDMC